MTNYECYKGLYSSFNTVQHVRDQPQPEPPVWPASSGRLYTGKHLLTFVDNHDVTRIATHSDG